MNRTLLAAGALALAVAASGCSGARPDAATVNGTSISRADFEDHLQAFVDNEAYQASVAASNGQPILGPGGEGTVRMSFTSDQLTNAILFELIGQELEEQGLEVTPEARQQAEQEGKLLYAPPAAADDVWAGFPNWFREQAVDNWASYLALQQALGGGELDDAALQAIYDENEAQFTLVCARHILVETEEEAAELKAQLDGGADFAELAAQAGTDATAQEGGRLYTEGETCPPASTYVAEFADAALALPDGEVSDPVSTQFGWHLIVVDEREVVPFEEAKEDVRALASQQASQDLRQTLLDAAANSDITVSPRFGSWDGEAASVQPPGGAASTTVAAG